MIFHRRISVNLLLNILVVIILLYLPYYIFEGKLFIGGDDTRLFYLYPREYIYHIAFYSWNSFSSFGTHNPNQYSLPLILFWVLIESIISSKIMLNYLAFSLPLIIAFLSFRYLINVIFNENKMYINKASFIGALLYILSPITLLHQISVFLITVWFLAIFPFMLALLLKYLKTGKPLYLLIASLCALFFSIAFYSIPWLIGTIIPMGVSIFILFLLYRKNISFNLVKRLFYFVLVILLVQAFWVLPFASTFLVKSAASFGGNILTGDVADTFRPVVTGTATGNIINPIMILPHQKIIFDYNWPVKDLFTGYYRVLSPLNLIYPFILFGALIFYKKILNKQQKYYYLSILGGFVIILFLFTVNIGPFKELFLLMGRIPGFVIFRNFYDKFAIGFIFYFSLLMTYSFIVIFQKFKHVKSIFIISFCVLLLNAAPIKKIINASLWGTNSFSKNISYPNEYHDFIRKVDLYVEESANILSLPFNIASYAIISENENAEAYIGTSPITLLTGLKNISGNMSLSALQNNELYSAVKSHNYAMIKHFLKKWNINYIIVYNSIPDVVKSSYLFDKEYRSKESKLDILNFTKRKIIASRKNRFTLYETGIDSTELSGNGIIFKKVSPVEYWIALPAKPGIQSLTLNDSFHKGWKLYQGKNFLYNCDKNIIRTTATECLSKISTVNLEPLKNILQSESKVVKRKIINEYSNTWLIKLTQNDKSTEQFQFFILYFTPQYYFYIGTAFTFLTIIAVVFQFIVYDKKKNSTD